MTVASSAEVAGIGWQSRGRDMRHSRIFGALMLASVVMVTMPPYASCGIIDDKAERNPRQAEKEARKLAREAKMAVSDSWLTAKTKIELFADERIKFRQISVETVNGTVRLRGTMDSEEARAAAISVARRVDGVRRVRSDLQVVRPGERKTVHATDREITQQVKAGLSRDADLKTVHARTDHGVVTLTGQVTDIGAGSRASEIAGGVPGVRSVKNELTYRSPHGNTDRSVLGALILFMSGKAPAR
jgi:hyperosmotically inducible periplasmic protein